MKKQSNHVSDKGLISKVHLTTHTTHIKQANNPIKKKK